MAIKVIIELKAHPGMRDQLNACVESLVAQYGSGVQGFVGSTRYEVPDDPDVLVEIADWESSEARDAHMREAAASGAYAPLFELLGAPFRATVLKALDDPPR